MVYLIILRQSIYRWIRNSGTPSINYDSINNGTTLYIMTDEKWIHKQDKNNTKKKKWIMSKCFVIFTHIKSKGKRNILKGKHSFITSSSNPYKELMDEICKIYDFEKIKTINLLSDAVSWILAGKSELKLYAHNEIVVNTCEFHVKDKQTRKDKITEYKNYIIKHWKGVIAMKYSDIRSSMESHISHCIASHFGSRSKAYSDKYIQTYLKYQEASLNNINILDYYLKLSYQKDNYTYNEKEISFAIFDK